ncbi:hypothetical protein HDU89_003326 [Geranomyces variabilis]|nr:hypothetical protein HDU89_003326 [Geranomyces variabilis]
MFAKSFSLVVAVAALGAVAQLPTDLPFPIPTDIAIPSVLPSDIPTGILPSGLPIFPTVSASASAAAPTRAASAVSSAASRAASKTSSAASAPAATASTTPMDCKAFNAVTVGLATGCLTAQQAKTPNITSQADADAAFQSIAKCMCTLLLPMQADVTRSYTQCPDPATGKLPTDADKAQSDKDFATCKAGDYATVASTLGITLDGTGGKKWTATPPAGSAKSAAASAASSAVVGLAGLLAAGFVLLA